MAAVAYGHVAIVPKGIWNADTQYEVCQLVEYDGSSYVAKAQPPVGTLPTDTSYWQVSAAGTKKASSGSLGTVMPDGSTTEVNEEGKLSAKTAQHDAVGVVKGSDDITVGEDGNLTVNTEFEQATELANLIAGEAIKSVLGKVSKAIAATMNLDQNALLKNMISGIDVNSGEKVPSSAFVHTLYERLGMGTDLSAGDAENVTQAVNALYSDLVLYNNPITASIVSANNKLTVDAAYIVTIAPKVYICYGFVKILNSIGMNENIFAISNLANSSSLLFYGAESGLFTPLLYRNGNMIIPNNITLQPGYYYVSGTLISN